MRFKSMLSRIMMLHVAAMAVTAVFIPLVLYWFLRSDVQSLQHQALREQTESVARRVVLQPNGTWSFNLSAGLRDQYSDAYGRYSYAVLDESGRTLFASREDRSAIFPIENPSAEIEFFERQHGDRVFSGASLRKELNGRTVWIQVGENLAHRDVLIDDVVANFIPQVGWITLPILFLLLVSDFVIFRRAIQPLLRASDQAAHISPTQIDVRLPINDIPREIRPLVIAVNQALDRLEEGFRRQHEFTADAAHELRTPLAILRTRIETLPDKTAAEPLRRDVESMSRVVSQLLDAAELDTAVVDPHEKADLQEVSAEVAEFIAPLALAQGKTIALTGTEGPVWIIGNAEMLRRAIRNLVENALNHTPPGTDVEIVVREDGMVSVLDQGEGIPDENRRRIFERFWRRDRRRAGGAGLGLSIVQRIVEAHGGAITVEDAPTGGANFSISFRLAAQLDTPLAEPATQRPIQDLQSVGKVAS